MSRGSVKVVGKPRNQVRRVFKGPPNRTEPCALNVTATELQQVINFLIACARYQNGSSSYKSMGYGVLYISMHRKNGELRVHLYQGKTHLAGFPVPLSLEALERIRSNPPKGDLDGVMPSSPNSKKVCRIASILKRKGALVLLEPK